MGVRKLERFANELAVTANDSSLMSFFSDINTDKIHRSAPKGKKMCVKYELNLLRKLQFSQQVTLKCDVLNRTICAI